MHGADGCADDVATSKLLLGCLLKLSVQMKNLPQLLRDMMQDLHSQLGDVDQVGHPFDLMWTR